jgi:hypothetical protein
MIPGISDSGKKTLANGEKKNWLENKEKCLNRVFLVNTLEN